MNKINLYIDGACNNKTRNGGWGIILKSHSLIQEINGFKIKTTNNRMELTAAIKGLKHLKKQINIKLYTDSRYVKNGIEVWIYKWEKNSWKTLNNKLIKNLDLWKILLKITKKHKIIWNWIKAHKGDLGNESADKLAKKSINLYFTQKNKLL